MKDLLTRRSRWTIRKYASRLCDPPYAVEHFEGNLALNEGIAELLALQIGGAATPFDESNSYLGVGDSATPAAAAQTGLQASTNKVYVAVTAGFPTIAGQTISYEAEFGAGVGTFDWEEYTLANGDSDAAVNLNRKVESHGSKGADDVWVLELDIDVE